MVIDKKYITQVDTFKDFEIFDENFLTLMFNKTCMLPEKSMLNKISLRIDDIDDRIGVPFVTCRKYRHFKILVHASETFMSIWSSVKSTTVSFVAFWV